MSPLRTIVHCLAILAVAACGGQSADDDGKNCVGKCDSPDSKEGLVAALDGFGDPVSEFLRESANDVGAIEGGYRTVLEGIGTVLGCQSDLERHYMVLTNENNLPRSLITHCSNNPTDASRFFAAMTATQGTGDIEDFAMHLVGWDAAAYRYRHFLLNRHPEGGFRVQVQPEGCLTCHGEAPRQDRWHPKMNELGAPWTGWNAEPGFPSHGFHENLDPAIAEAPVFTELSSPRYLDSASNFEATVRAGMDRVTNAHMRERRGDWEDLKLTLSFLEPLFCDEAANYVSEDHTANRLRMDAVVDESLTNQLSAAAGSELAWANETHIRLPAASSESARIARVPVRPQLSILLEEGLVARGLVDTRSLLQLRAIDWQTPSQSDARCQLYRKGESRIMAGNIGFDFADLPESPRISDLIPLLFAEIMQVEVGSELVSLLPSDAAQIVVIDDATTSGAKADLESGEFSGLQMDISEFTTVVRDYVNQVSDEADRQTLHRVRNKSVCALREFELASLPIVGDVLCE